MTPQSPMTDVLIVPDEQQLEDHLRPVLVGPPMLRFHTNARREVFPVARPDLEDLERFMWACDAPYQKWVRRARGRHKSRSHVADVPASIDNHPRCATIARWCGVAAATLHDEHVVALATEAVAAAGELRSRGASPVLGTIRATPGTSRVRAGRSGTMGWCFRGCAARRASDTYGPRQGSRGPIWRIWSGSCGRAMRRTGSGWGGTGASQSSRRGGAG